MLYTFIHISTPDNSQLTASAYYTLVSLQHYSAKYPQKLLFLIFLQTAHYSLPSTLITSHCTF